MGVPAGALPAFCSVISVRQNLSRRLASALGCGGRTSFAVIGP